VLKKQKAPIVDARKAGSKPATEALGAVFGYNFVLDILPFHTERRVGEQVVEGSTGVTVFTERVP
jgi:hypothetical protein